MERGFDNNGKGYTTFWVDIRNGQMFLTYYRDKKAPIYIFQQIPNSECRRMTFPNDCLKRNQFRLIYCQSNHINSEQHINKVVIDILIMSKSIVMGCSILCLLARFIFIYTTRTDEL